MDTKSTQAKKPPAQDTKTGKVRFDDRGNAVWETSRGKRLEHDGLALLEEEVTLASPNVPVNAKGGRIGYDPYQSGLLKKKKADLPRKKDLRALSQWIQVKKAVGSG